MMDLVHVRSFAEVAERGTVAAAAASLGFTPPAVSQHVAKLETELGAKLFDRAGQRLRLTDSGQRLLPVALNMIDLETQGRSAVTQPPQRPHFVIAGFASAIATLIVPKLAALDDQITLDIVESEDLSALRDLRLGSVDLVLTQEYDGLPTERDDRLVFTPLATDQLRLVVPSGLAATTNIAELATTPWLVNGHGTRCSEATARILQAAGIEPPIAATVADNETLLALVAAGHGVTIVPELLLTAERPGLTITTQELGISRTILAVNREVTATSVAPLIEFLQR